MFTPYTKCYSQSQYKNKIARSRASHKRAREDSNNNNKKPIEFERKEVKKNVTHSQKNNDCPLNSIRRAIEPNFTALAVFCQ